MRLKTFLWMMVLSTAIISCSDDNNDDDFSINNSDDDFSITNTSYESDFQGVIKLFIGDGAETSFRTSEGIQLIPSRVNDPAATTVTLAEGTDPSISYDPETGRISWAEELPLDETTVDFSATYDGDTFSDSFTITNRMGSDKKVNTFSGSYTNGISEIGLSLEFSEDGLTVTANDTPLQEEEVEFERTGYEINITFKPSEEGENITLIGTIDHESGQITGDVFNADGIDIGDFIVNIE
ncbi:MAG: hypothetical protein AAF934_03355 [Bacteroidota bacterium]